MALSKEQGGALWLRRWPDWVRRASETHQGRYSYPSADRQDGRIRVVCPEHGEFWQRPAKHMHGQGCPKCSGHGSDKLQVLRALFPAFDWSAVGITTTKAPLTLTCPEHGAFTTTVNRLTTRPSKTGNPCPACSKQGAGVARRVPSRVWSERVRLALDGKVELDESTVTTSTSKARFVCQDHGEFWSTLSDVAAGHGCPTCGDTKRLDRLRATLVTTAEQFVERARAAHGDRYDYDISSFTRQDQEVRIICPEHGEFWQIARNHTTLRAGCPRCAGSVSKGEDEIAEFLAQFTRVERRVRNLPGLQGQEVDVHLLEFALGIEYCGVYWHGEAFKDPSYHQSKTLRAAASGLKLLTIFEDEWRGSPEKVKAKLLSELGRGRRLAARRTRVAGITWTEAKAFLEAHHMQGAGKPAPTCHALVGRDGEVVAVATWGRDRFSASGALELYRFCCESGTTVVGGLGKLVKHAERTVSGVKSLLTYADLRWGTGDAYSLVGFAPAGLTPPGYAWCKGATRFNRHRFQKHKLAEVLKVFDPELSEVENCHRNGYWRVFDSGHTKWVKVL